MKKKTMFGGGFLLLAGTFFGRETAAYILTGFLNLLTAGARDVTLGNFPWANALGTLSFLAGVIILIWPWLRRIGGRITLNEDRVFALIDQKITALPAPDQSSAVDLSLQLTEKLDAQSKFINDHQVSLGNALDERFATLETTVSNRLKNVSTDINSAADALGAKIAWMEPFITKIERDEIRAKAENIAANLRNLRLQKPHVDGGGPPGDQNATLRGRILSEVSQFGIDVQSVLAEAQDGVLKNSIYLLLKDEDVPHFVTEEAKQNWHVKDAQTSAVLRAMKDQGLIDEV